MYLGVLIILNYAFHTNIMILPVIILHLEMAKVTGNHKKHMAMFLQEDFFILRDFGPVLPYTI